MASPPTLNPMAADRASMLFRLAALGAIASGSRPAELSEILRESQRSANFGKSIDRFKARELTKVQGWRKLCLTPPTTRSRHIAYLASKAGATLELENHL
jgi:hypothetical protein